MDFNLLLKRPGDLFGATVHANFRSVMTGAPLQAKVRPPAASIQAKSEAICIGTRLLCRCRCSGRGILANVGSDAAGCAALVSE